MEEKRAQAKLIANVKNDCQREAFEKLIHSTNNAMTMEEKTEAIRVLATNAKEIKLSDAFDGLDHEKGDRKL